MITFIKINPNRYISNNRSFSLIKHHDYYQILMNSKIPTWESKFSSVKCAEKFLNGHNYVKATTTHMPMSSDDIEFIIDMYGFNNVGRNKWMMNRGDDSYTLSVQPNGSSVKIAGHKKGKLLSDKYIFDEAIDAIDFLDSVNSDTVIKCCNSLDEFNSYILAASQDSIRNITRKLVRVKSSNLWAYMIDIKDRHDSTGDVYIQFKGKNGGPGDIYKYYDVKITDWRKMLSSTSKGHAFWVLLRNRYMYSKLTGDKKGKLRNAINH